MIPSPSSSWARCCVRRLPRPRGSGRRGVLAPRRRPSPSTWRSWTSACRTSTASQVLRRLASIQPGIPVLILTAFATIDTAIEAIREGATTTSRSRSAWKRSSSSCGGRWKRGGWRGRMRSTAARCEHRYGVQNFVGQSPLMVEVYKLVARVASLDTTVLIQGETGTGKELVARAIHYASPRAGGPVRRRRLRGAARGAVRVRAVRPRARRVHRRAARRGAACSSRRPAARCFLDEIGELSAGAAGQAAARAPGAGDPARRRQRLDPGRRAHHRGDQPRSREARGGGRVPRGPLLPAERRDHRAPAAPGAPEDVPLARRSTSWTGTRAQPGRPSQGFARETLPASSAYDWPGQRPRAGECDRAGGGALLLRADHARGSPRAAARRRRAPRHARRA